MAKNTQGDGTNIVCFLCGKPADKIKGKLIQGVQGHVCKECVHKCVHVFAKTDAEVKDKKPFKVKVPSPIEIKEYLDQYVIGQERAKKVLSVAICNHYRRLQFTSSKNENDIELDKSNILLTGSTGTGKTLLVQTIAKMLKVPCAISDATTLTEAGYVGADPENALLRLLQAANGDIEKAEMGIVVLDEFDKKAARDAGVSVTRDVSGSGVQGAILKMIEGTVVDVPLTGGRKHPNSEIVKIDTKNILFVLLGSFFGLDKIIKARIKGKSIIGFGDELTRNTKTDIRVTPEDLIEFGMIPEIIGRIPVISMLHDLTEADLLRILSEPKNAILKQYAKMAQIAGVSLTVDDDAKIEIAKLTFLRKTGARGLRAIVEDVLIDVMYSIQPGDSVRITKEMIVNCASGKAA